MEEEEKEETIECSACERELDDDRYVDRDGDIFCQNCYEDRYGRDCDNCNTEILREDLEYHNGLHYCEDCHNDIHEEEEREEEENQVIH